MRYWTLELDDDNWLRIHDYLDQCGLNCRIYYHEPDFRVCVVRCSVRERLWLQLLA